MRICLGINNTKTKVMAENVENPEVRTINGTLIEVVDDFNYLGAWIASTQKDIRVRRARAWSALHSMNKVWKSEMSGDCSSQQSKASCCMDVRPGHSLSRMKRP